MVSPIVKSGGELSAEQLIAQRPEIFRKLLSLGLAAGGVGVGSRTLLELFGDKPYTQPFVSPGPSPIPVPVAAQEEERRRTPAVKLANSLAKQDWADRLSQNWTSLVAKLPIVGHTLNSIERGASTAGKAWWNIPAGAALGAGGVAGGWSLADWLLDRSRKQQTEDELSDAKRKYQQALLADTSKQAEASPSLSVKLDRLCDSVEKHAAPGDYASSMNPLAGLFASDTGNAIAGTYLTALGTLLGGTGYAGYRWAKSRSPSALMNKALKERARHLWGTTAQPVEAVPVPVDKAEAALAAA